MCRDKKGNKIETTRQQPLPKKLLSIHNMIWFVRLCLSLCVNRLAAVWFHLGYYIHSTYNIVANVLQIRYTNIFLFCVVRVRNSAIIIQIDQSARSISCYHPKYQSLVLGFFYIIDVDSWKFGDKKFSYSNFMWSNEWWTNWMNWFFFSSYTFDFLRQRFSMSVMNTGIYEHWTLNIQRYAHAHTHFICRNVQFIQQNKWQCRPLTRKSNERSTMGRKKAYQLHRIFFLFQMNDVDFLNYRCWLTHIFRHVLLYSNLPSAKLNDLAKWN